MQMRYRTRVGYGFAPLDARSAIDTIQRAEAAGVEMVWTVMRATGRDTPTLYAAALTRTSRVKLGTAIVPAFTRHPLALVTQMLTLEDLAPGRIRLGIGTSHQRTMIPIYGFDFSRPLAQLREYLQVLRPSLHDGKVTFEGEFYRVNADFGAAPKTPILISTLRARAFELAGELTDGAITWLCPVDYILSVGKPALERGAAKAGRPAPPIVAHVLVAPRTDREAVRRDARQTLTYYAGAEFYRRMFADAGFPLGPDNAVPDALIDELVVSGDADGIAAALRGRLDRGLDELVVSLVPGEDPAREEAALLEIIGSL